MFQKSECHCNAPKPSPCLPIAAASPIPNAYAPPPSLLNHPADDDEFGDALEFDDEFEEEDEGEDDPEDELDDEVEVELNSGEERMIACLPPASMRQHSVESGNPSVGEWTWGTGGVLYLRLKVAVEGAVDCMTISPCRSMVH
jgi:hypothetical protein